MSSKLRYFPANAQKVFQYSFPQIPYVNLSTLSFWAPTFSPPIPQITYVEGSALSFGAPTFSPLFLRSTRFGLEHQKALHSEHAWSAISAANSDFQTRMTSCVASWLEDIATCERCENHQRFFSASRWVSHSSILNFAFKLAYPLLSAPVPYATILAVFCPKCVSYGWQMQRTPWEQCDTLHVLVPGRLHVLQAFWYRYLHSGITEWVNAARLLIGN